LAIGEAAFGVISLMTRPFADVGVRARSAAARLAAIPAFLDGARRSIERVPEEWRTKALRECDGVDRLLTIGIPPWIGVERIDDAGADRLKAASGGALNAIQDFRRWLEREVPSASADRYAIGADVYNLLLHRGHWCDRSAAQLAVDARDGLDAALAKHDEL